MTPDLFWIPGPWRGRLAISARPRGGDWLEDEASGWRRAGIDMVVSLLETNEATQLDLLGEGKAVEKNGIRFFSFPIPDRGVPVSTKDAVSVINNITHALETGKNVAVHCRQGIGRSGLIAAGVLMMSGAPPERALQAVSAVRGTAIPETPEQHRWAQQLPSELPVPRR